MFFSCHICVCQTDIVPCDAPLLGAVISEGLVRDSLLNIFKQNSGGDWHPGSKSIPNGFVVFHPCLVFQPPRP